MANPATEETQTRSQLPILGFYILAVLFNLCLTAQLLTVGLAQFYNPTWWQIHILSVRGYSGIALILLVWVYWLDVPKRVRILTATLPILLALQFLTIHLQTPVPLAIAHPLIGFSLFSVSTTLVHRIWRILANKNESN
ncbi:MAG: hypothetical protein J7647_31305 [Cyanobacteria bacterium SBLK]|nr:hypothetical protein [Cyanobacteria bacterium SBLK]